MSDNLFESLLVQDLEIPIVLEKEFTAACCIRGYHIYSWTGWTANIGSILTVKQEIRPGALVEDQYAIAICSDGQTIGHVPKFLSKLTYFFIKSGGELSVRVTGERRYSHDLAKGGMEVPADFIFKTSNANLYNQMKEKTSEKLVEFENRRKIGLEKSLKKKETKNKK